MQSIYITSLQLASVTAISIFVLKHNCSTTDRYGIGMHNKKESGQPCTFRTSDIFYLRSLAHSNLVLAPGKSKITCKFGNQFHFTKLRHEWKINQLQQQADRDMVNTAVFTPQGCSGSVAKLQSNNTPRKYRRVSFLARKAQCLVDVP